MKFSEVEPLLGSGYISVYDNDGNLLVNLKDHNNIFVLWNEVIQVLDREVIHIGAAKKNLFCIIVK